MKDNNRPLGDMNQLYLRSTLMLMLGLPAYLYFFVPRFAAFVNDFGVPLPYPAQMMVSLSNSLGSSNMAATITVTALLALINLLKERYISNPLSRYHINYYVNFALLLLFVIIILSTIVSMLPLLNELLA